MGILFGDQLNFHHHITTIGAKVNHLLGLMKRSFNHLDLDVKLFATMVRPTLEYCSVKEL